MDLIPTPEWSDKQMSEYFELTMKQALSYGLTSIHDPMARLSSLRSEYPDSLFKILSAYLCGKDACVHASK